MIAEIGVNAVSVEGWAGRSSDRTPRLSCFFLCFFKPLRAMGGTDCVLSSFVRHTRDSQYVLDRENTRLTWHVKSQSSQVHDGSYKNYV